MAKARKAEEAEGRYARCAAVIQAAYRRQVSQTRFQNTVLRIVAAQSFVRRYLVFREKNTRQQERVCDHGDWSAVVESVVASEIQVYKRSNLNTKGTTNHACNTDVELGMCGKSWSALKLDLGFIAQSDSVFDDLDMGHHHHLHQAPKTEDLVDNLLKKLPRDALERIIKELCSENTPLLDILSVDGLRVLSEKVTHRQSAQYASDDPYPNNTSQLTSNPTGLLVHANAIHMTAAALKWVKQQKDYTIRHKLAIRLEQLAKGDTSYCLRKVLKGGKRDAWETKLDTGDRIIWTQQRGGVEKKNHILIWFVCKVCSYCRLLPGPRGQKQEPSHPLPSPST
jgi:hypothetical protein